MRHRRARLGRLQARARSRLCRARGAASPARLCAQHKWSDPLMATTTARGGQAGGQVGRPLPRLEAREKVTGRAEYTHTMRLPGMVHGKIFRSTVAHGRIKSIDTSAAKKGPGVYRVVTSQDVRKVIPEPYYGPAFHDQPILALGKVRHVGGPVAGGPAKAAPRAGTAAP